ncbi:MAG: efflux RND transporter permease subunit [Deltaproteobacteria bacterium]|nr:efflux RND transporter permease subunit [Deltaproteobacteria bacterium]
MNLSSLSVRRAITFSMAYLMLVGFGLFCLMRLQLDLYPDISFPTVLVITNYTGASPEDVETLLTRPIESAVSSAKNAEEIRSTSKQGVSLVEVKFDWGMDMEQAETDVRRKLEMVEGFLPEDADEPLVFAFDPSMQPVVMMTITGPYRLDELRTIAIDELQPRIERLPGIASAEAAGGLEREIQVVLDPVKIDASGLDINAVVAAIYKENTQMPGGSIDQGTLHFSIQTQGKYQTVEEIGEVMVGMKQEGFEPVPIRLKEVAEVRDAFVESERIIEIDGVPAVWMIVRKQSGENTVKACRAVIDALPRLRRESAADIDFKVIFNQADFINKSLGNLSNTALVGIAITFIVLFWFLRDLRSALIVSAAIPISVIATFAVMDSVDMTLNVLSMAGLALAVGMLVDNSIVVLENIFRLREEGRDAITASISGSQTVTTAVIASTLTTVSVFVPVLFVPGIAGVMFKDMAVTICFSLLVSLVVALSFIPLAASRLLTSKRAERQPGRASAKDVVGPLREVYGKALDWSLAHRWAVGAGLLVAVGLAALLALLLPTEFVTESDQSMVFVSAETPVGNNLNETYEIIQETIERIKKVIKPQERKLIGIDVGIGKGFVAIFSKGVHAGVIRVPLVDLKYRKRKQQEIEDVLREELEQIPGLKATVAMPFNMMGSEGDIEIQIRGHELAVSRKIGLELRDRIAAMPEMVSVNYSMEDQKPEIRVVFDRPRMAELGISSAAVTNAISTYFMGRVAGRYSEGGDEYDILVRYEQAHRLDIDEIRRMPVAALGGQTVPLANIARVDIALGPVDITRLDQERVTRLICKLKARYVDENGKQSRKDLRRSIASVTKRLEAFTWPKEFSFSIGGTAEDFITSFRYLGLALAVSILLVFAVMASQFESLRQPFIIIFTVPLAAIGVVLMFVLTGSTVDIGSLIGVIMLVGIVVNNGIIMVDAANQIQEQGQDRFQAISRAARLRMRPVLMTSATTILAMVPMALGIGEGSEGWSGMAKAVIGGLTVASFLTLFVVPTMYTLFARKQITKLEP